MKRAALFLAWVALAAASPESRAQTDLHHHWDQRCQPCHGHAGAFARATLTLENRRVLGAHHRDTLELFLRNHYLNDELVAPMMAMLAAQLSTPPLFQERCARCHGTAAEFARRSLALRDGALVGLPSGRKVADLLATHGGATATEQPLLLETLERVRQEVSGAANEVLAR